MTLALVSDFLMIYLSDELKDTKAIGCTYIIQY